MSLATAVIDMARESIRNAVLVLVAILSVCLLAWWFQVSLRDAAVQVALSVSIGWMSRQLSDRLDEWQHARKDLDRLSDLEHEHDGLVRSELEQHWNGLSRHAHETLQARAQLCPAELRRIEFALIRIGEAAPLKADVEVALIFLDILVEKKLAIVPRLRQADAEHLYWIDRLVLARLREFEIKTERSV